MEVENEILVDLKKKERTCYLTGGSGFVGFNLLLELLEQGWKVICLCYEGDKEEIKDRLLELSGPDQEALLLVNGNILKIDTIRESMPEEIDCVFHLAGNTVFDYKKNKFQTKINVDGTRNVLEVAIEKKVKRFVHTSSSSVYGLNSKCKTLTEDSYKGGMDYELNYGQSKYQAEMLVLEASKKGRIDAVTIQPDYILGENDLQGFAFSIMFNKVFRNRVPLVPDGYGSFSDVKEIAKAFISAYENGKNGEWYLLGGENLKIKEFIALIGKEMKISVPQLTPPKWLLYYITVVLECGANCCGCTPLSTTEQILAACRNVIIDSSKAQKELGYKITPVQDLIRRQVKFMRENKLFENDIDY